ncbi:MAG TPA: hypothetical protein VKY26_11170, partial [Actinomycetota bacterium]|nr:hypothetical protein [Actinomycetota bacterium]
SAEFSPSTGDVLTDLDCGAASSIVKLNPATGDQIATVLAPPPGESVGLGPIDSTGTYLMYQTSPNPPPTTLTAPVPVSWFVLANGRSTPLAVPPHATPEAW